MYKKIFVFIINTLGVAILLFFQYLMYAFLPASNINSIIARKNAVINLVIQKDLILLFEMILGLVIMYFLNKKIIPNKKRLLTIFIIELIIITMSLLFFSFRYIRDN